MASSKVMASSNSRNSDLTRRGSTASSSTKPSRARSITHTPHQHTNSASTMTFYNNPSSESTLLDAQITLIDNPIAAINTSTAAAAATSSSHRTVDDVWREIVSGERKEMKEEANDEIMTLEDFLAKAGAVDDEDVKVEPGAERLSGGVFAFDPITPSQFQPIEQVEGSIVAYGNGGEVVGRGRRGRGALLEPMMDKAAEQKQRRMIKNRESAARSRERKQAHQIELEAKAARLEEENALFRKEKAEKTKERLAQLKEKVIPVVEKRRPAKALRRTYSWNC